MRFRLTTNYHEVSLTMRPHALLGTIKTNDDDDDDDDNRLSFNFALLFYLILSDNIPSAHSLGS